MSLEGALSIAKQIAEMQVRKVDISGGEPLCWPHLAELVRECSRGGAELAIYTSGNVPQFGATISRLRDCGVSKVIFSVFGGDTASHERITRHSGSFEATLDSLYEAVELGLTTEFHFVPLAFNYRELSKVIQLARKVRVSRISVLRFVPQGRGAILDSGALSKVQNRELKRMIEEGREHKGIDIRTGSPYNFLMVNDQPKCCAAIDRMIVGPDYDIYPCDAFKQIRASTVVKTEEFCNVGKWTVSDCWNKSPYLRAVREYLTSDFPDKCKGCGNLEGCLSGCLAQKVIANGSFKKDKDPMCLIS